MQTFFSDNDYATYRGLLAESCERARVAVWAYCLMPNHVHLILVPQDENGLRSALAGVHRRYATYVNQREGWTGHLWQSRFASIPMDESHLIACGRYVELNPVRAGLVARPQDWRWSSARAHLAGRDDILATAEPLLTRVLDWADYLAAGLPAADHRAIQAAEVSGRPLGSPDFLRSLGEQFERDFAPKPRGRPPRTR